MCDCDFCKRHHKIKETIERKNVNELIILVEELSTLLSHVELDYDVDEAILSGKWPSAILTLENALENAKKIQLSKKLDNNK
jgi:hypothetical protein